MYQRAIDRIRHSIFPIFFGNESVGFHVSGTGFFIDNEGTFITALHVIENIPENTSAFFAGNIPYSVSAISPLKEIIKSSERDVFIGKVVGFKSIPVTLDFQRVGLGRSICISGYPFAQLLRNPDGSVNAKNVRQYWQPTYSVDEYSVDELAMAPHFIYCQAASLAGMSGGPVFGLDGKVIAINLGTMSRKSTVPNNSSAVVDNTITIDLLSISDLIGALASEMKRPATIDTKSTYFSSEKKSA